MDRPLHDGNGLQAMTATDPAAAQLAHLLEIAEGCISCSLQWIQRSGAGFLRTHHDRVLDAQVIVMEAFHGLDLEGAEVRATERQQAPNPCVAEGVRHDAVSQALAALRSALAACLALETLLSSSGETVGGGGFSLERCREAVRHLRGTVASLEHGQPQGGENAELRAVRESATDAAPNSTWYPIDLPVNIARRVGPILEQIEQKLTLCYWWLQFTEPAFRQPIQEPLAVAACTTTASLTMIGYVYPTLLPRFPDGTPSRAPLGATEERSPASEIRSLLREALDDWVNVEDLLVDHDEGGDSNPFGRARRGETLVALRAALDAAR